MKVFLRNNKKWLYPGIILIVLIGVGLIWLGLTQDYKVTMDGETITVRTAALKVSGVLRAAGIEPTDQDHIVPAVDEWVWGQSIINIESARVILIKTPQEEISLFTAERIPANLLDELGITLYPQDQVWVNGEVIDPLKPLNEGIHFLQYEPATPIILVIDNQESTIYTHQSTLGEALDDGDIQHAPQDRISHDLMTPINGPLEVKIRRAQPVTVHNMEASFTRQTAAATVGEALEDIGLPLQNLDYSIPAEDEPLPEDRQIEVVRVSEQILLMTDEVAYENEYVEDPNTVLDQTSVVEPGQVGIYATRERVQYENGEEVWRDEQESWQASEAKDGVLGYGTKIEIRTEVVDGVTIEYWRKKYVFATSYEPCDNQGVCHDGTAGGYPLQKGIVAVTPQWYSVPNGLGMADLPVYVPGYGHAIIGDVGGGIPGTPWIDVAYRPEDNFTWNAHWTTMYFLTPVPPWVPPIIVP